MVDFAKLKAMRGEQSLAALTAELEKITAKRETKKDDRFWSPTVDKAGNGYAVIRFLPAPGEEDVPFVRIFDHGFHAVSGKDGSFTIAGVPDGKYKLVVEHRKGGKAEKDIEVKGGAKADFTLEAK